MKSLNISSTEQYSCNQWNHFCLSRNAFQKSPLPPLKEIPPPPPFFKGGNGGISEAGSQIEFSFRYFPVLTDMEGFHPSGAALSPQL
jgi:hypothetical protein